MIRLIYNEMQKIIKRKRFLMVLGFMILLSMFCVYMNYRSITNMQKWNDPAFRKNNIEMNIKSLENQLKTEKMDENSRRNLESSLQAARQELEQLAEQIEYEKSLKSGDWKGKLEKQIANLKKQINETNEDKGWLISELEQKEYLLENNIRPETSNDYNAFKALLDALEPMAMLFIPILAVVLTADMVSSEFHPATIKLLLIRPVSKWKILLSKYITLLITTTAFIIIGIGLTLLISGLAFGWGGGEYPVQVGARYTMEKTMVNGMQQTIQKLQEGSPYFIPRSLLIAAVSGFTVLANIVLATLAFAVSTILRKSAGALTFSILSIVGAFVAWSMAREKSFMIVNFMNYLSLDQLWKGRVFSEALDTSISVPFALCALGIWWAVAIVTSFVVFTKRQVMV